MVQNYSTGLLRFLKEQNISRGIYCGSSIDKVFDILMSVASNRDFVFIIGQNITADAIDPTYYYSRIVFKIKINQRFILFIIYLKEF